MVVHDSARNKHSLAHRPLLSPLLFLLSPAGSSISAPDLSSAAEDGKDAASDLKAKAKGALDSISALPNPTATLGDLNADVRGLSAGYRDPAGAIQQDKATGGWLGGGRLVVGGQGQGVAALAMAAAVEVSFLERASWLPLMGVTHRSWLSACRHSAANTRSIALEQDHTLDSQQALNVSMRRRLPAPSLPPLPQRRCPPVPPPTWVRV